MAERAHPDDPGFQHRWEICRHFGFVPMIRYVPSPYRKALEWRYRWVNRYCRGKDALDAPCGVGWGTSLLRGCRSVIGLDLDSEAIEYARRHYGGYARFVTGDMRELPFGNETFDVVACLEGIEHVPRDVGEAFLKEADRVLRKGGNLFISSPTTRTGAHSGNPFHLYEYGKEELVSLLQASFRIGETMTRCVDELVVHYFRAEKAVRPR